MQLNKFGFRIRAKSEEDGRAKLKFCKPARMPFMTATGF